MGDFFSFSRSSLTSSMELPSEHIKLPLTNVSLTSIFDCQSNRRTGRRGSGFVDWERLLLRVGRVTHHLAVIERKRDIRRGDQ